MESPLGVALWEIKLNLCDAVGDDRGDDGDVHDVDDDDKQVVKSNLLFGEKRKSVQSHLELSEDDCH